jgi:hypothetical protein
VGHGVSSQQPGLRTDDDFNTFTSSTYFLNAGSVFDTSLLDGLLATGETATFKNVFTSEKTVGGYSNTIQSTVINGGDTYALWSAAPVFTGGKWYCSGYRTSPLPTQTALFESSDGRVTWTFTGIIAADAGKSFSEAGLVKCLNGDFVAVIREDSGAGRPLYLSRCTSGVLPWSTPALLAGMEGTQPCLLRLANGDVMLLTGDRSGRSGLGPAGAINDELGITGISCWRSSDHCVTWSNQVMLSPMWSTDGGQPMAIQLDSGMVGVLCYLAPGATNGDNGLEPGIYWITFDPNGVV